MSVHMSIYHAVTKSFLSRFGSQCCMLVFIDIDVSKKISIYFQGGPCLARGLHIVGNLKIFTLIIFIFLVLFTD